MRTILSSFLLLVAAFSQPVFAQLTIEITKGIEGGIPIAVVPFKSNTAPPQTVNEIIEADLVRSGRFDAIPRADFLGTPSEQAEVKLKNWRLLKAEGLVIGKVNQTGNDLYSIQFELMDVFRGQRIEGRVWNDVPGRLLRKVAHQISDLVYKRLTGQPGAFDTRVAYVTAQKAGKGTRYKLMVADSDGYGPQEILGSKEPILSPAWSPDGSQLAYVSFEGRRSGVWIQRLSDGSRRKIAGHPGSNSAPAWSPNGQQLAVTLSKDGNAEIYVANVASGSLRRITNHSAIDTEPAWSPDGGSLVFSSGRSGSAQIYRVSASGGTPERITFDGKQNQRASFSPNGQKLTLITQQGGRYRVGILDLRTRILETLTDGSLDESPSFAPNGAMILYATRAGGKGVLAAVSADGRVKQLLQFQQGDVREPAWSPFNRKL